MPIKLIFLKKVKDGHDTQILDWRTRTKIQALYLKNLKKYLSYKQKISLVYKIPENWISKPDTEPKCGLHPGSTEPVSRYSPSLKKVIHESLLGVGDTLLCIEWQIFFSSQTSYAYFENSFSHGHQAYRLYARLFFTAGNMQSFPDQMDTSDNFQTAVLARNCVFGAERRATYVQGDTYPGEPRLS